MFDSLEADIVVFQETKIQRKDLRDDMVLVPGWDCYFSLPRFKKGKSLLPIAAGVKLTPGRIFGRRDIHTQCHMCSNSCRRRHHGRSLPAQFNSPISRSARGPADWRLSDVRAADEAFFYDRRERLRGSR